jgi:hypothetical protein
VIVDAPRSRAASSPYVAIAVLHVGPVLRAGHAAARERVSITPVGMQFTN